VNIGSHPPPRVATRLRAAGDRPPTHTGIGGGDGRCTNHPGAGAAPPELVDGGVERCAATSEVDADQRIFVGVDPDAYSELQSVPRDLLDCRRRFRDGRGTA